MSNVEIPDIELFTDGGAEPNPGKGGFGIILRYKGREKEFFAGYEFTTNNRMELMAVIYGLERIKTKAKITVYSDSKYVINGIVKGWAKKWRENNWIRKKNAFALNKDLWKRLLEVVEKHEVKFNWVKGHAGHVENERCDYLANLGIHSENKANDEGYLDYLNNLEDYQENNIKNVGDICKKCNVKVIKKHANIPKNNTEETHYYQYYLYCTSCRAIYRTEEAKRKIPDRNTLF